MERNKIISKNSFSFDSFKWNSETIIFGKEFFINLLFYLLQWFLKFISIECQKSSLSRSIFLRLTDVEMSTSMLVTKYDTGIF